ncbi:hypothetical protein SAMN05446589_9582 [Streptomyces sp. OV198]|jgi:hypothetical protein|uniref:hypothetical protein n=1 Tax=Streptomyces sp. OV198 TaxID=1882787 RepID=UPI000BDDE0B2|nr:hypothetical protein [Streptomyces sp. OV198]SOF02430.1 hypothetical protein SAMN05446589_9582 [Streptomyces sp. OV198]
MSPEAGFEPATAATAAARGVISFLDRRLPLEPEGFSETPAQLLTGVRRRRPSRVPDVWDLGSEIKNRA